MKVFIKRILSLCLSCCCILSVSACRNNENSNSSEGSPKTSSCSHSYTSEVTKEATCKETGIKTYICGVCGDSYTEDIAKLTTHSYTSEVTKEATCKETGIKTYTCDICGKVETQIINKTSNHNWQKATCISPKSCTICGTTSGYIDKYAHSGEKECKTCGVNYHQLLANYIQTYGTYSNDKAIIKRNVYTAGDSYNISLEYVFSSGGIIFGVDSEFSLSLPSDTLGEYEYYYLVINLDANIIDSMRGTLIAKDITTTTTQLPYEEISSFQNKHTNTYIQANASKYVRILLSALNEIFKDADLNITTKHFGFENY